jgi:hypothetical protein
MTNDQQNETEMFKDHLGRAWSLNPISFRTAKCSRLCREWAIYEVTRATKGLRRRELVCSGHWREFCKSLKLKEITPIQ